MNNTRRESVLVMKWGIVWAKDREETGKGERERERRSYIIGSTVSMEMTKAGGGKLRDGRESSRVWGKISGDTTKGVES